MNTKYLDLLMAAYIVTSNENENNQNPEEELAAAWSLIMELAAALGITVPTYKAALDTLAKIAENN